MLLSWRFIGQQRRPSLVSFASYAVELLLMCNCLPVLCTCVCSDDEPMSALAFKIMNDPFVGTLTFTRIYRYAPHLNVKIVETNARLCNALGCVVQGHLSLMQPLPFITNDRLWAHVHHPGCASMQYSVLHELRIAMKLQAAGTPGMHSFYRHAR